MGGYGSGRGSARHRTVEGITLSTYAAARIAQILEALYGIYAEAHADPSTNTWSRAANMAKDWGDHTATLLGNGKVPIAGGHSAGGRRSPSTEVYDPSSKTWRWAVEADGN